MLHFQFSIKISHLFVFWYNEIYLIFHAVYIVFELILTAHSFPEFFIQSAVRIINLPQVSFGFLLMVVEPGVLPGKS